jgi:hypothetical protein
MSRPSFSKEGEALSFEPRKIFIKLKFKKYKVFKMNQPTGDISRYRGPNDLSPKDVEMILGLYQETFGPISSPVDPKSIYDDIQSGRDHDFRIGSRWSLHSKLRFTINPRNNLPVIVEAGSSYVPDEDWEELVMENLSHPDWIHQHIRESERAKVDDAKIEFYRRVEEYLYRE